ncbi:MAG: CDP-alcohol phosphatidyltransferase family protein [Cyclobacteriaceae bacterium]|nr:CDP-alcohol phosphatidyltransferase family protein [Cyclobacteriaceae bacterium]
MFKSGSLTSFYYLLFKSRRPVRIVNTITFFRIVAFPIFIMLLITDQYEAFRWLIVISFITDSLDGFLARKFKVSSILGSRLDSLGDDLTVLAAIAGVFVYHLPFLQQHWMSIVALLMLYLTQVFYSLIKYQKLTSFHTYLGKVAAVSQAMFLVSIFFTEEPITGLYYVTIALTAIEMIEETIMINILPLWRNDVRSFFHAQQLIHDRGNSTTQEDQTMNPPVQ